MFGLSLRECSVTDVCSINQQSSRLAPRPAPRPNLDPTPRPRPASARRTYLSRRRALPARCATADDHSGSAFESPNWFRHDLKRATRRRAHSERVPNYVRRKVEGRSRERRICRSRRQPSDAVGGDLRADLALDPALTIRAAARRRDARLFESEECRLHLT